MSISMQDSVPDLLSDLNSTPGVSCILLSADEQTAYKLHPEEGKSISGKAVAKRRAEFVAGRAAANRAMQQLGINEPPPVPQGKMREPLWPEGIAGSITHSHPWTIAVAAYRSNVSAIGIDLENSARMKEEGISRHICSESERAWMRESGDPLRALTMIFSSKEAIFKAFSPRCQRYFGFKDAQLVWLPDRAAFRGELLVDLDKKYTRGYPFEVRCRTSNDWVFAHTIEKAP
jgi:4'-phosphopantetheinyl transferase EntD